MKEKELLSVIPRCPEVNLVAFRISSQTSRIKMSLFLGFVSTPPLPNVPIHIYTYVSWHLGTYSLIFPWQFILMPPSTLIQTHAYITPVLISHPVLTQTYISLGTHTYECPKRCLILTHPPDSLYLRSLPCPDPYTCSLAHILINGFVPLDLILTHTHYPLKTHPCVPRQPMLIHIHAP